MVRRQSVTSTDSGAKSYAYAAESAALAIAHNRLRGLGVPHRNSNGALIGSTHPAKLSVSSVARMTSVRTVGPDPDTPSTLTRRVPIDVSPGGATRDITSTTGCPLPGQVGMGAPGLGTSYDMPVIDQQSGRWYVKDIRASTQPMGSQ